MCLTPSSSPSAWLQRQPINLILLNTIHSLRLDPSVVLKFKQIESYWFQSWGWERRDDEKWLVLLRKTKFYSQFINRRHMQTRRCYQHDVCVVLQSQINKHLLTPPRLPTRHLSPFLPLLLPHAFHSCAVVVLQLFLPLSHFLSWVGWKDHLC